MDKSPILPADHDPACRREGPGALDADHCERCRNLFARRAEWRATSGFDETEKAARDQPRNEGDAV